MPSCCFCVSVLLPLPGPAAGGEYVRDCPPTHTRPRTRAWKFGFGASRARAHLTPAKCLLEVSRSLPFCSVPGGKPHRMGIRNLPFSPLTQRTADSKPGSNMIWETCASATPLWRAAPWRAYLGPSARSGASEGSCPAPAKNTRVPDRAGWPRAITCHRKTANLFLVIRIRPILAWQCDLYSARIAAQW